MTSLGEAEGLAGRPRRASKRVHASLRREKGSSGREGAQESRGPLIVCARCQNEFQKTRPWSRFCSTVCRMKFHGRLSGYCAGPDNAPVSQFRKDIPS